MLKKVIGKKAPFVPITFFNIFLSSLSDFLWRNASSYYPFMCHNCNDFGMKRHFLFFFGRVSPKINKKMFFHAVLLRFPISLMYTERNMVR